MERFKKILCYVGGQADPSPAIENAAGLAERNKAALTLVDVLPASTEGPWLTVPGKPELEQLIVTSRTQDLEEMATPLRERGLGVDTEVTTGSPFVELIRRVVTDGHDLVVKTAQNFESRLPGLLGTTALHLMRKCPAPVWVVHPSPPKRFGRVVAAVDLNLDVPNGNELSLKVLKLASSLAATSDSELQVVHAWWLPSESLLRSRRINMPPAEVDAILRETRGAAERALDALVAQVDLSNIRSEVHLTKGQPQDVIRRYASEADVVVMGTLSRANVAGLFIGNTAERILQSMDTSVLTVKPEGFETPLSFDIAEASST